MSVTDCSCSGGTAALDAATDSPAKVAVASRPTDNQRFVNLDRMTVIKMSLKKEISPYQRTMTHAGCSNGNAINPTAAAAAIKSGLLTFHRNRTPRDARPMR